MYSHLFIFTFGAFAFGVKSKKSLPRLMSRSLLLSFSSRCFMASGLTLKSLIHFGLVVLFYSFVCDYPVFLIPRIEMIVKTVIYNSLSGNSQICFFYLFIFGCTWFQLWHVGLVAPQHVGSQFPDQGLNLHSLHWKADSQLLDHQGRPRSVSLESVSGV